MAGSQLVLVCLMILCVSSIALSLKCQACGPTGVPCGDANIPSIACEAMYDRCMTVTVTMASNTMVQKNCSISKMMCQKGGEAYLCQPGDYPSGAKCNITCCQGDLCNKASPGGGAPPVVPTATTPKGTEPPSAGVAEFTATVGAIFMGFAVASLAALE